MSSSEKYNAVRNSDERKIKEIIFGSGKYKCDVPSDDNNIIPQLLDFLHNQISDLFNFVERSRHVENNDVILSDNLEASNLYGNESFSRNGLNGNISASNVSFSNKVQAHQQPLDVHSFGNVSQTSSTNQFSKRDGTKYRSRGDISATKINYCRKPQNSNRLPPPNLQDESAFPSLGSCYANEGKKRVKPSPTSKYASPSKFAFQAPLGLDHSTCRPNNTVFTLAPLNESNEKDLSLKKEREQLKAFQVQSKHHSQDFNSGTSKVESQKYKSVINTSPSKVLMEDYVLPDNHKVTKSDKLIFLANFYASCVNSNCIPNLATEFYFICQLLTVKIPKSVALELENQGDKENYLFLSIHNCVYFAVLALELCPMLLTLLKPTGLRMILDMPYISNFSSHLRELVELVYEDKFKSSISNPFNSQEIVEDSAYQEEIDSRNNFISEKAFSTYRKQRDMFKKLLREWECHSHQPDWLHGSNFKNEVRNISIDNSFHMSRLFLRELEAHCMLEDVDKDMEEELGQFEGAKLKKLQKRMKSSLNAFDDPNISVVFPDTEGFFRDFILFNTSISFYQNLLDKFHCKVTELSCFKFDSTEPLDVMKKEKFFQRVKSLRLYAKFLGFLYFLPYRTAEMPPTNLAYELETTRSHQKNIIDVNRFIVASLKEKSLTLVIPWVVEYLCNMDKLAPTLPEFQKLFELLMCIYRHVVPLVQNKHSCILLKLCVGRVFEHFSRNMFFKEYKSGVDQYKFFLNDCKKVGLDDSFLVDDKLVYMCCPNIGASESLLRNYFSGKINKPRKIKPYAVEDKMPNYGFLTEVNYLQRQLEANFFHVNPPSLKDIVDFSSERAASKAKEAFQTSFLPKIKDSVLDQVNYKNMLAGKNDNQKEFTLAIGKFQSEIWAKSPEFVKVLCDELCLKLITLSVSESYSTNIVDMAAKISSRVATNRVFHFIQTYSSNESLRTELKDAIKARGKLLNHNDNVAISMGEHVPPQIMDYSIITMLEDLRSFSSSLLRFKQPPFSPEKLLSVIENCHVTDDYLTKSLKFTVADWYIILIIFKPEFLDYEFTKRFFVFFQKLEDKPYNLLNPICPRNFELLMIAPQKVLTWRKMTIFVIELLSSGWLSLKELEGQCLSILKLNWPDEVLNQLASLLHVVVDNIKALNLNTEFSEIMEWLSWFCQES